MTNKQRTLIFMAIGTVVSLFLTIAIILLALVLGYVIMKEKIIDILPLVFMFSILLSLFIYQRLTVFVITKWDLEDKLDPLFKTKKRKPRQ
jgi:hypothetical protein